MLYIWHDVIVNLDISIYILLMQFLIRTIPGHIFDIRSNENKEILKTPHILNTGFTGSDLL